ncbi:efflux RND transporter periplasmic adaptor subunit [Billgrantia diversa]|nr:efflux RND transporter periplasmic adaptor subunit [Halomonas sp. MCCC 1A13316]
MPMSRWIVLLVALVALAAAGLFSWRMPVSATAYEVKEGALTQQVVASGRVVASSRAQIGSEIVGRVTERLVREGQQVEPGDILVVLDSTELAERVQETRAALRQLESARRPQAEAGLADARAHFEQARREHERARRLLESNMVSRQAVEQAEEREAAARAALERSRLDVEALAPGGAEEALLRARLAAAEAALERAVIHSPVTGTVLTRNVEPGDVVQPGRVLLEIARTGQRELRVPFDERHLGQLAVGQRARCVTDAYPDQPFDATISLIAPIIDAARGTVDVRLVMEQEPWFLREDMTVSVNVETARLERALTVPNDAIFGVEGASARVHGVEAGRVSPRSVTLGLRGLLHSEITAGLTAGEIVLTDPGLSPGQRIRPHLTDHPEQGEPASSREPFSFIR